MATRGVQPLCLTWIPAVWTLRHVLSGGRRAARRRRRVVSLTLLLFFFLLPPLSLSLSENPWCALLALLCRPGENVIGGVIYLCYFIVKARGILSLKTLITSACVFCLIARARIWPPIHPRGASDSQSSPSAASLNKPTRRRCSASGFARAVPVLIIAFYYSFRKKKYIYINLFPVTM